MVQNLRRRFVTPATIFMFHIYSTLELIKRHNTYLETDKFRNNIDRVVLFEVVPSVDTSSCVMGIERPAACRGVASVLWSDNGRNFIAIDMELLQNVSV